MNENKEGRGKRIKEDKEKDGGEKKEQTKRKSKGAGGKAISSTLLLSQHVPFSTPRVKQSTALASSAITPSPSRYSNPTDIYIYILP